MSRCSEPEVLIIVSDAYEVTTQTSGLFKREFKEKRLLCLMTRHNRNLLDCVCIARSLYIIVYIVSIAYK